MKGLSGPSSSALYIYSEGLVNHPYLHDHKFLLHKSTVSNIRLKLGYIKIFDLLNGG